VPGFYLGHARCRRSRFFDQFDRYLYLSMPDFYVVVPGIYFRRARYFYPRMPDIYTQECCIFSHRRAGFLTQFDDLYLSMLIFFVVVPGIYLSCAGYFYPIMLDIYTPECRIFLHRRARLLTQFDGYSVYTSVCRFFFIVVPGIYFGHAGYFSKSFQVFTPPNFYVFYAGFYIRHAGYFYLIMLYCFLSLTGIFNRIYTSACQFFLSLCRILLRACQIFTSGVPDVLPNRGGVFTLQKAGYLYLSMPVFTSVYQIFMSDVLEIFT
jgi:hypothetical protein